MTTTMTTLVTFHGDIETVHARATYPCPPRYRAVVVRDNGSRAYVSRPCETLGAARRALKRAMRRLTAEETALAA